jgi:hypothetical protein
MDPGMALKAYRQTVFEIIESLAAAPVDVMDLGRQLALAHMTEHIGT